MYPDRDKAEEILREAEGCNPGPWGNRSRTAAHCAEKTAEYSGMDPEKAYVLGLPYLNTVTTKPAYEANGYVSVCKIRSDIKMDS